MGQLSGQIGSALEGGLCTHGLGIIVEGELRCLYTSREKKIIGDQFSEKLSADHSRGCWEHVSAFRIAECGSGKGDNDRDQEAKGRRNHLFLNAHFCL